LDILVVLEAGLLSIDGGFDDGLKVVEFVVAHFVMGHLVSFSFTLAKYCADSFEVSLIFGSE